LQLTPAEPCILEAKAALLLLVRTNPTKRFGFHCIAVISFRLLMGIQKGNRVFYYTLWGEELFSENQERSIRPQTDIFETATGKRYTLKSTLGYYQIFLQTKKGVDLVYARPIFEYFGCVLLVLCIPVNFILIFMLVLNCLLDPAFETQYDLFAGHKRHPS